MQLFVDTADLNEIKEAAEMGVITGVTTNPTLLARNAASSNGKSSSAKDTKAIIQDICQMVPHGPVSMEVISDTAEGMLAEGREFVTWADNVFVKVPFNIEGMKAVSKFTEEGINTNVTLVFSVNQALLAANAGATFISSFVGRLDDIGFDGIQVIKEAVEMVDLHDFDSQILAASIRHPLHVTQSAAAGAHIATIPFKVLKQMYDHPLTEKGIQAFKKDWEAMQTAVTA